MNRKYIGFAMKDGCHVKGADKGIEVINKHFKINKIIEIEKKDTDLETVIVNDLKLANSVNEIQNNNELPITLGGDHSLAIGSIAGSAKNNKNLGVIWIDTHPDSNTNKTTTTFGTYATNINNEGSWQVSGISAN